MGLGLPFFLVVALSSRRLEEGQRGELWRWDERDWEIGRK